MAYFNKILRMQLDKTITCRNGRPGLFLINVHGPQRGTQSTWRQPLHPPGCWAPFAARLSRRKQSGGLRTHLPDFPVSGGFPCLLECCWAEMCPQRAAGSQFIPACHLGWLWGGIRALQSTCIATPASGTGTRLAVHCTLIDPNISSNRL